MADIKDIEEALYDLEECISAPDASKLTGVTKPTIISWCEKYNIGKKIGGRWYVYPNKLNLLLRGALKSR